MRHSISICQKVTTYKLKGLRYINFKINAKQCTSFFLISSKRNLLSIELLISFVSKTFVYFFDFFSTIMRWNNLGIHLNFQISSLRASFSLSYVEKRKVNQVHVIAQFNFCGITSCMTHMCYHFCNSVAPLLNNVVAI